MASSLLSVVVVAVVLIGGILLLARTRAAGGGSAAVGSMADPVPGTLPVTAIGMPRRPAIYHMARLTGGVSGDGIEPLAVQHSGLIASAKRPRAGQALPVVVDRSDPRRFAIEWGKVQRGADAAMDQAEALAATMRARQGEGSKKEFVLLSRRRA